MAENYTYNNGWTVQDLLNAYQNVPVAGDQTADVPQYQTFQTLGITDPTQQINYPVFGGQTLAQRMAQWGITDPLNQLNAPVPDAMKGSLIPTGNDLGGVLLALAPLAMMVGGAAGVGGLSNAGWGAEGALAGAAESPWGVASAGDSISGVGFGSPESLLGASEGGSMSSLLGQSGMNAADTAMSGIGNAWEGAQAASSLQNAALAEASGQAASGTLAQMVGPEMAKTLLSGAQGVLSGGDSKSWGQSILDFLKTPGGMTVAGSLLGSGIGALGSYFSSKAQQDSAKQGMDTIWNMYQQNRADLAPWREAGVGALGTLRDLTTPGKQFDTAMLDPGYGFGLSEGLKAGDARLRAMGMADSGAAVKAATRYGNDYATKGFGDVYNRLANLAGLGQVGTTAGIAAGTNAGNNIAGLQTQAGNARASGYMGGANAIAGGIGQGLNLYNQLAILDTLRRG